MTAWTDVVIPGEFKARVPEAWEPQPVSDPRLERLSFRVTPFKETFRITIFPPIPEAPQALLRNIARTSGAMEVVDLSQDTWAKTRTARVTATVRFADHDERVTMLYLSGGIIWISMIGQAETLEQLAPIYDEVVASLEPSPLFHNSMILSL